MPADVVQSVQAVAWSAHCNDLGEGTSVYFPVFRTGAQFFTGDPHGVQANGRSLATRSSNRIRSRSSSS
jgi:hypothetical protein